MKLFSPARRALAVIVMAWSLSLSPVSLQAEDTVAWSRVEPGCTGRAQQVLNCGTFGEYLFGQATRGAGCTPEASGVAEPLLLAADVETEEQVRGPQPSEGARWPEYGQPSVIDFWSSHGVWVSRVTHEASTAGVRLRMLESSSIQEIQQLGHVSDLHVLEALCHTIEYPEWIPKVVNMSFGRLLDGPPCDDPSSVPCEISRLLTHMREEVGVVLVAAAGNHEQLLFPASEPSTIAVGMLDSAEFAPEGNTIRPAPGTPDGYDALIPGTGLVTWNRESIPPTPLVYAPGSSFASAFLSGWLAAWEDQSPGALQELVAADGLLSLRWGNDGGYYLAADGKPFEDSRVEGVDKMLDATFGVDPEAFAGQQYPDATHQLTISSLPSSAIRPLSRQELMRETNLPNPGSTPCVPCRLRRRAGRSVAPATRGATTPLVLETAAKLMPTAARLDEVRLSVDGKLYDLEGDDYAAFIVGIAASEDVLVEIDLPTKFLAGQRLALLYFYTRLADDRAFYDEVALAVHLGDVERLSSDNFESADLSFWTGTAFE